MGHFLSVLIKSVLRYLLHLNSDKMPRNPDELMSLPPSELKSLSNGEYRVYCGMKFEALEKSGQKLEKRVSKLNRRLWYFLIVMVCMLTTAIISMATAC